MRSQMSMKSTLHIKPRAVKTPAAPEPPKAVPEKSLGKKSKNKKVSFKKQAIFLGVLLGGSAVAIGWSLGKLNPMNQRQESLNQQVSEVTDSIARLEFSIHPAETQKVEEDYTLAIQSLFNQATGFPKWQNEIQQQAKQLDLQVKAFLGTMQTQKMTVRTVRILPMTLEIFPLNESKESANSIFQRLIQFNDILLHQSKRVELISIQVVAGTNSIQRVEQTLNLWFEEEES